MDKQYAIFDMDGTLIDSMRYWADLAGEYLARKGVTELPADLMDRIAPMTMTESAALFLALFGLDGTPQSVAAEMNGLIEGHYRADIPLKPGVLEHLMRLRARNVTCCVASATDPALMEACLARLGVLPYFDFLLSCEEVGAGKDRPDVYLEAACRLGAAPHEIAVYEDAYYAAETAKAAGFYTVGVYDASADASWEKLTALADEAIRTW